MARPKTRHYDKGTYILSKGKATLYRILEITKEFVKIEVVWNRLYGLYAPPIIKQITIMTLNNYTIIKPWELGSFI